MYIILFHWYNSATVCINYLLATEGVGEERERLKKEAFTYLSLLSAEESSVIYHFWMKMCFIIACRDWGVRFGRMGWIKGRRCVLTRRGLICPTNTRNEI